MAPLDVSDVAVTALSVERETIDASTPAGKEIDDCLRETFGDRGGLGTLWPLATERLSVEIGGLPAAYANAIRRVVLGELPGRALEVVSFDHGRTTEKLMLPEFVEKRISLIRLAPQIPDGVAADLRLSLDVKNETETYLPVYAGDLEVSSRRGGAPGAAMSGGPLFNPLAELARLSPGKTMVIPEIRVATGRGDKDAAFAVASRAVCRPLDLEELPRAQTHARRLGPAELEALPPAERAARRADGAAGGQSGFATSSAVANPRRHRVQFSVPAVPAGTQACRAVLLDAVADILRRLGDVAEFLAGWGTRPAGAKPEIRRPGMSFAVSDDASRDGNSGGLLVVAGETETVGQLLVRTASELFPGLANASSTCIAHSGDLRVRMVCAADEPGVVLALFTDSLARAQEIFEAVRAQVRAA